METTANALRLPRSPIKRFGLAVAAILTFLLFVQLATGPSLSLPYLTYDTRTKELAVNRPDWRRTSDYDVVVAYYNEGMESLADTVKQVVDRLPMRSSHRVIIYYKGERDEDAIRSLLEIADEVVWLPNIGREGETYLNHITRHYDTAATDLAGHTIFLQPHFAWHYIIGPRLLSMSPGIGFMSLGPYINTTKGVDVIGNDFPRIMDIFSAFRSDLCPPGRVLSTWAGQFVVSRKRILNNTLRSYRNLQAMFHAPPEHWIWKEGWHNNSPENPTLGHALERSWPAIFDCWDPEIATTCGEGSGETCRCMD